MGPPILVQFDCHQCFGGDVVHAKRLAKQTACHSHGRCSRNPIPITKPVRVPIDGSH